MTAIIVPKIKLHIKAIKLVKMVTLNPSKKYSICSVSIEKSIKGFPPIYQEKQAREITDAAEPDDGKNN